MTRTADAPATPKTIRLARIGLAGCLVVSVVKTAMTVAALAHVSSALPAALRVVTQTHSQGMADPAGDAQRLRDQLDYDLAIGIVAIVAFALALLLAGRPRLIARAWISGLGLLATALVTVSLVWWPYTFDFQPVTPRAAREATSNLLVSWYDNGSSGVILLFYVSFAYALYQLFRTDSTDYFHRGSARRPDADTLGLGEILRRRREAQPGD